MDEIENALKTALQREPAPAHLAAKVHREIKALQPPTASWWRLPQVRWAAVGVAALACVAGGLAEHTRQQQLRGQQARQQVLLALRITGSKLRIVQEQVLKLHAEGETRP
jgi:hypothetical protein